MYNRNHINLVQLKQKLTGTPSLAGRNGNDRSKYVIGTMLMLIPMTSVSSGSDGFIKLVLRQRDSKYLVQIVGEPANNAVYVASSAVKARVERAININPPTKL